MGFLFALPSLAKSHISVVLVENNASIKGHLCLLEDTTGLLGIDEVSSSAYANKFTPLKEWTEDFSTKKVYWGMVVLENQSIDRTHWILKAGRADDIQVHIPNHETGFYTMKRAGYTLKTQEKDYPNSRLPIVQFVLPRGSKKVIYFRWDSRLQQSPLSLNVEICPPNNWYQTQHRQDIIQSFFQGIIFIMFVYTLALFYTSKDIIYLYYALYIFTGTWYYLHYYGYAQVLFFPSFPELGTWMYIIGPNLASIFYLLFLRCYSAEHPLMERWTPIIKGVIGIKIVFLLSLSLLHIVDSNVNRLSITMQIAYFIEELFYLVMVSIFYRTGDKLFRYFALGTFFLAGGILFGLTSIIVFKISPFYYTIFNQVGIVMQIFLFSLGLGYRMKLNEQKRRKAQEELIAQLQVNEELQYKQNEELERKVKERVHEIEEQKERIEHHQVEIEAQNEELRHINEEKNNLIHIVAHDLKSPLSRIHGLVDIIQLAPEHLNSEQVEYMSMINNCVDHLQQMVTRILSVDTVDEQQYILQIRTIKLVDFIRNTTLSFQKQAQAKKVRLRFHSDVQELHFPTDTSYLKSILENLISNALKFSPPSTSVEVSMKITKKEGITIMIRDEGPGFTDSDKEKLFRKYQRLSAKPTGGESSTGLGLSIVQKYTHLLNGHIKLDSTLGKGTCFSLYFPTPKGQVSSNI